MKSTIIAIAVGCLLIVGAIVLSSGNTSSNNPVNANNVSVIDGKQIVTINTKGGYQPQKSVAKAGMPTIIRFATSGTFDCSSSVRIPSLGISKVLPSNGNTDIDIGTPQVATLQGLCVMGMYRFEIEFQS
ncbi:MAG: cupredoxin domain-containing protein [Parcubacteria group bacterium]